ncbi:hypothetical protein SY88_16350 [Clostridiales bacterium PH28_bin88]|nr:hypothetical protein SY88_16350 [Clostridiales bacterium PH28_bin88]
MEEITIEVQLFSGARDLIPQWEDGIGRVRVRYGATVKEMLQALGVAAVDEYQLLLNGNGVSSGADLHQGDRLAIFPHFVGG